MIRVKVAPEIFFLTTKDSKDFTKDTKGYQF
jgi:hypothetical protein